MRVRRYERNGRNTVKVRFTRWAQWRQRPTVSLAPADLLQLRAGRDAQMAEIVAEGKRRDSELEELRAENADMRRLCRGLYHVMGEAARITGTPLPPYEAMAADADTAPLPWLRSVG